MLTTSQWQSLIYLKPSDFKQPDGLQYSIVSALDRFINLVGSRPLILSDYRPGDPKTHGAGLAIDTTWPELEPLEIYDRALNSGLFNGVGIYVNEAGAVSFHFDTRPYTLRTDEPNRWGGIITHPYDPAVGDHVRQTEYVAAGVVIDILKKKGAVSIIFLIGCALIAYKLLNR